MQNVVLVERCRPTGREPTCVMEPIVEASLGGTDTPAGNWIGRTSEGSVWARAGKLEIYDPLGRLVRSAPLRNPRTGFDGTLAEVVASDCKRALALVRFTSLDLDIGTLTSIDLRDLTVVVGDDFQPFQGSWSPNGRWYVVKKVAVTATSLKIQLARQKFDPATLRPESSSRVSLACLPGAMSVDDDGTCRFEGHLGAMRWNPGESAPVVDPRPWSKPCFWSDSVGDAARTFNCATSAWMSVRDGVFCALTRSPFRGFRYSEHRVEWASRNLRNLCLARLVVDRCSDARPNEKRGTGEREDEFRRLLEFLPDQELRDVAVGFRDWVHKRQERNKTVDAS